MPNLFKRKKTAIGLFVDGNEIKFALLSKIGKTITIEELRSASFSSKLEDQQLKDQSELEGFETTTDNFSIDSVTEKSKNNEDNNAILLGLLGQYKSSSYSLGYSISEPSIYYHTIESDFGLKGNKLKERIMEELRKVRAVQPTPDAVDAFYSADSNLVCAVREDGLSLYRSIEEIKSFLGNRIPRIPLIDTMDISLINICRANYDFAQNEISVIVYIGVEFSRLIFLKGSEFLHFAPMLAEGYDSPNIQNTLYSRILLEQDSLGIPHVDKIFIAGESKKIAFDEFLKDKLPDIDIQYLRTPILNSTNLPIELQEQIHEYAVAIGTAWKILDDLNPAFYPTNLLPDFIRESQRAFKLGWHGYALLVMIFLSTLYFTWQIVKINNKTSLLRDVLTQKQFQLAENREMENQITNLYEQIKQYSLNLAVYDSIVPGYDKWSKMIEDVSNASERINSLWITELKSTQDEQVVINGFSIYRSRIPRIAKLYDNIILKQVIQKEIREKTVYSYELLVPKENKKNEFN